MKYTAPTIQLLRQNPVQENFDRIKQEINWFVEEKIDLGWSMVTIRVVCVSKQGKRRRKIAIERRCLLFSPELFATWGCGEWFGGESGVIVDFAIGQVLPIKGKYPIRLSHFQKWLETQNQDKYVEVMGYFECRENFIEGGYAGRIDPFATTPL